MRERAGAFSRLLVFPLALVLAAGCPLDKSTYVLRRSGQDWLRMGSDPNGEMILRFTLGRHEKSIALPQVIDRIRIERLDRRREPMDPRSDEAPAFIRIEGLAQIADVPDGEWRLAWCTEH
jgi:hypothetical protein